MKGIDALQAILWVGVGAWIGVYAGWHLHKGEAARVLNATPTQISQSEIVGTNWVEVGNYATFDDLIANSGTWGGGAFKVRDEQDGSRTVLREVHEVITRTWVNQEQP